MRKVIILAALLFAMPSWAASEGESGFCDSGVPAMNDLCDAAEPAHTAPREISLRQALDEQGYSLVRFMMGDSDTLILWGTVQTQADRLIVQTQVFLVARTYSIEDRVQVLYPNPAVQRPILIEP